MSNQVTIPDLPDDTLALTTFMEGANPNSFRLTVQDFDAFYQLTTQKGENNGYAGLDGFSKLLITNFPSGSATEILARNSSNDALEFIIAPLDGILTINGNNLPTQIIDAGTGIDVSSLAGTTTITLDANFTELNDVTVTSTVGNIVFFNSGWVSLAIGNEDDVLTVNNSGLPVWAVPLTFSTLESLTDTIITSRAANEVLIVNPGNSAWINKKITNDSLALGVFLNIQGLATQITELGMGTQNIVNIGTLNLKKPDTTALVELEGDHDVPVKPDIISNITFYDRDSLNTTRRAYASIEAIIEDPSTATLAGKLVISVTNTTSVPYITLNDDNTGDITLSQDVDVTDHAISNATIDADDGVDFSNIPESSLIVEGLTAISGWVLTSNGVASVPTYQAPATGDVQGPVSVNKVGNIAVFTNTDGKSIDEGGTSTDNPSINTNGDLVIARSINFSSFTGSLLSTDEYIVNNNETLEFNAAAYKFSISGTAIVDITVPSDPLWTFDEDTALADLGRIIMSNFNSSAANTADFIRIDNQARISWDHATGNDSTYMLGDDTGFTFVVFDVSAQNLLQVKQTTGLTLLAAGLPISNITTLDFIGAGASTIEGIGGDAGILVDLEDDDVFRIDEDGSPIFEFNNLRLEMNGRILADVPSINNSTGLLEILEFANIALAENNIKITNATQSTGPILETVGSTALNVDLNILTKGTGVVDLNATLVKDGLDPIDEQDLTTKKYVDSVAGLGSKEPVRVATTAAGDIDTAFENGDIVDGVTLVTGDRILIKDQTLLDENGVYTVNATSTPTRATDSNSSAELEGASYFVTEGTANQNVAFVQTRSNITIETDPIFFVPVSNFFAPLAFGHIAKITAQASETVVIATIDTYVPFGGTAWVQPSLNSNFTATTAGLLTYTGTPTKKFIVDMWSNGMDLTGTSTFDQMVVGMFLDNTVDTPAVIPQSEIRNDRIGQGLIKLSFVIELSTDFVLDMRVQNITGTSNYEWTNAGFILRQLPQ